MDSGDVKLMTGLTVLSIVVLAAAGRFVAEVTPDTAGYLELGPFPEFLGKPRTPLYGWFVNAISFSGGHAAIPFVQISAFVAAVWLLAGELRAFGLSRLAMSCVAAVLLFSNAVLLLSNLVHPEFPAIACALFAVGGTIRLAGPRPRWWGGLLVLLGAGAAYVLRPSFLPLIPALPVLFTLLRAIRGTPVRPLHATVIFVLAALPFISASALRAAAVGDANIVSFGGFQMSGLAGLMLSEEVVQRLPSDLQEMASGFLMARQSAEESGRMIGIPRNSSGVRSFHSAALGYFDVLARTYDDVLYGIIAPTRRADESWVAFNRRMMRFSLAVVRAAPDRYAAWLVGATTRLIGRAVAVNLPLALALIVIAGAWAARQVTGSRPAFMAAALLDTPVLALLAALWFFAAGAMSVLVTFPALRYIDTASLLLAAPFAYWAVLAIAPRAGSAKGE
jgi:hypothetical protein